MLFSTSIFAQNKVNYPVVEAEINAYCNEKWGTPFNDIDGDGQVTARGVSFTMSTTTEAISSQKKSYEKGYASNYNPLIDVIINEPSIGWDGSMPNAFDLVSNNLEYLNAADSMNWTPAMYAQVYKNTGFLAVLMSFFADLEIECGTGLLTSKVDANKTKDESGYTALMHLSHLPWVTDIRPYVERYNLDLTARDNYGHTVIIQAAANGDIERVKQLQKLGGNINEKNNDGKTILYYLEKDPDKKSLVDNLKGLGATL